MISNREKYISLSTQKRDGSFVRTPVWFAEAETPGVFYVFSLNSAGKVKRIRNFDESWIASCTMRGAVTGEWYKTRAELIYAPERIHPIERLFVRKYRLTMTLSNFFSTLVGNYQKRQYIQLTLVQ